MIFISKHYINKPWTKLELRSAQSKAFEQNKEYILPIKLDNTEIPGILKTIGYVDARKTPLEKIVDMLLDKLGKPSTEHLRSSHPSDKSVGVEAPRQKVVENFPVKTYNQTTYLQTKFVGRDKKIRELVDELCTPEQKILFIEGMGGIGKSALIKKTLEKKEVKARYSNVIFLNYTSSLVTTINDEDFIENFSRKKNENDIQFFKRKLDALKKATNENTLIVVDNFNTDTCDFFDTFIKGPYSVVFTSRNKHNNLGYTCKTIEEIKEPAKLREIFYHYCTKVKPNAETDAVVNEILILIVNHTLTVELLAKQIQENPMTIKEMLTVIENEGFSEKYNTKYYLNEDPEERAMLEHILHIFKVAEDSFSLQEKIVLENLTLIPHKGISETEFYQLVNVKDINNVISKLERHGWVQKRFVNEKPFISMHPVINEVITFNFQPTAKKDSCYQLIETYSKKIELVRGESRSDFDFLMEYCRFTDKKLEKDTSDIIMRLRQNIAKSYSAFFTTDAVDYQEQLITKYKKYFDEHTDLKIILYAELAFDYNRIMDNFDKAEEYLKEALAIGQSSNGSGVAMGTVYNIYGDVIYRKDRTSSRGWREKAVKTWEQIKNDYPLKYSIALLNLAILNQEEHNYEEAYRLGQEALILRLPPQCTSEDFWDDQNNIDQYANIYIAKAYSDLGRFYCDLPRRDRLEKSLRYLNIALTMYKHIFNDRHEDIARTYEGMGLAYYASKKYDLAYQKFQTAWDIYQEKGSEAYQATVKFYLAKTLLELGETDQALEYANEVRESRIRIFGKIISV